MNIFITSNGMLLTEFVEYISGVHTTVFGEGSWDCFKSLGVAIDDKLLLSLNCSKVFSQMSWKLHFNGTTTGNDGFRLEGPSDNHDSVVEGSLGLFKILTGTTTEYEGAWFGLIALSEHVESFISELDLLELTASSENFSIKSITDSRLENSSSGLGNSLEIILLNSTSTEDISVSEVLGSEITDWESWEDDFSSRLDKQIKFGVNDIPLGIDNLLEIFWLCDPDFSIVLFSL